MSSPRASHVTLHVLDDDVGVVDHEPDGQNHREKREQVGSVNPNDLHEEDRADERHGDRDQRDQHGARDPRKRKITTMTMRPSRSASRTTSWMALLMYPVESKATVADIHPLGERP